MALTFARAVAGSRQPGDKKLSLGLTWKPETEANGSCHLTDPLKGLYAPPKANIWNIMDFLGNFIENEELSYKDFWLFLRSLSSIGSSRMLVGRIPLQVSSKSEAI